MASLDWMDSAVCAQSDPELFFAEGPASTVHVARRRARAMCAVCPVQDACLEFAIEEPWVQFGIWGGLDADRIRRLARGRRGSETG